VLGVGDPVEIRAGAGVERRAFVVIGVDDKWFRGGEKKKIYLIAKSCKQKFFNFLPPVAVADVGEVEANAGSNTSIQCLLQTPVGRSLCKRSGATGLLK
jgi:hypothetical protein